MPRHKAANKDPKTKKNEYIGEGETGTACQIIGSYEWQREPKRTKTKKMEMMEIP